MSIPVPPKHKDGHVSTPSLFDSLESNRQKHAPRQNNDVFSPNHTLSQNVQKSDQNNKKREHRQYFIGLFDSTPLPDNVDPYRTTITPISGQSYTLAEMRRNGGNKNGWVATGFNGEWESENDFWNEENRLKTNHNLTKINIDNSSPNLNSNLNNYSPNPSENSLPNDHNELPPLPTDHLTFSFDNTTQLDPYDDSIATFFDGPDEIQPLSHSPHSPLNPSHSSPYNLLTIPNVYLNLQTGPDEAQTTHILRDFSNYIENNVSKYAHILPDMLSDELGVRIYPWQFYLAVYLLVGAPYWSRDEVYKDVFPGPLFEIFSPKRLYDLGFWGIFKEIWTNWMPNVLTGKESFGDFFKSLSLGPFLNDIYRRLMKFFPTLEVIGDENDITDTENNSNSNRQQQQQQQQQIEPKNITQKNTQKSSPKTLFQTLFSPLTTLIKFLLHSSTHAIILLLDYIIFILKRVIFRPFVNLSHFFFPILANMLSDLHTLNPFKAYSISDYITQISTFLTKHIFLQPHKFIYPLNLWSQWYPITFVDMLNPGLPYNFPLFLFSNCELLIHLPLYCYKRLILGYNHEIPFNVIILFDRIITRVSNFVKMLYVEFSKIVQLTTQITLAVPFIIYNYCSYITSISKVLDKITQLEGMIFHHEELLFYQTLLKNNIFEYYIQRKENFILEEIQKIKSIRQNEINNFDINKTSNELVNYHQNPLQPWQIDLLLKQYQPQYLYQTIPPLPSKRLKKFFLKSPQNSTRQIDNNEINNDGINNDFSEAEICDGYIHHKIYYENQLELATRYYQQQALDMTHSEQHRLLLEAQLAELSSLSLEKNVKFFRNSKNQKNDTQTDLLSPYEIVKNKHDMEQNALIKHFESLRKKLGPRVIPTPRQSEVFDPNQNPTQNSFNSPFPLLSPHSPSHLFLFTIPTQPVFSVYTIPPPELDSYIPTSTPLTPLPAPTIPTTRSPQHEVHPPRIGTQPTPTTPQINKNDQIQNNLNITPTPLSPNTTQLHSPNQPTSRFVSTPVVTNTPSFSNSLLSTSSLMKSVPQNGEELGEHFDHGENHNNVDLFAYNSANLSAIFSKIKPKSDILKHIIDTSHKVSSFYNDTDTFVEIGILPNGNTTLLIQFTTIFLNNSEKTQSNLLQIQKKMQSDHLNALNATLREANSTLSALTPSVEVSLAHVHNNIKHSWNDFTDKFKFKVSRIIDTISTTFTSPIPTAPRKPSPRVHGKDVSGKNTVWVKESKKNQYDDFEGFDDDDNSNVVENNNGKNHDPKNSSRNCPKNEGYYENLKKYKTHHSHAMKMDTSPYSLSTLPSEILRNVDMTKVSEKSAKKIQKLFDFDHFDHFDKYLVQTPLDLITPLLKSLNRSGMRGSVQNNNHNGKIGQSWDQNERKIEGYEQNQSFFSKIPYYFSLIQHNLPHTLKMAALSILSNLSSSIIELCSSGVVLGIKVMGHLIMTVPLTIVKIFTHFLKFLKFLFTTIINLLWFVIKKVLHYTYQAIMVPTRILTNIFIKQPYLYLKRLFSSLFYHFSLSRFIYNLLPPVPSIIKYPIRFILAPLAASLILIDRLFSSQAYFLLFLPFHICGLILRYLLRFWLVQLSHLDSTLYHYCWVYIERAHNAITAQFPMIGLLLPLPNLFENYQRTRDAFDMLLTKFGPDYYLIPLSEAFYNIVLRLPIGVLRYLIRQVLHVVYIRDYLIFLANFDFLSPMIWSVLHFADFFTYIMKTFITKPLSNLPKNIQIGLDYFNSVFELPINWIFKPTFNMISAIWSFIFSTRHAVTIFNFLETINNDYLPDIYRYNPIQREYELILGAPIAKKLTQIGYSLKETALDTLGNIPYITDNVEFRAKINHPMSWDIDTTQDLQQIKLQHFTNSFNEPTSFLPGINDFSTGSLLVGTAVGLALGQDVSKSSKSHQVDFISSTMHALAALPAYEAWLRTFLPVLGMYSPVSTFLKIASNHVKVSETSMYRAAVKDLKQYWHRNDGTQRYTPRELKSMVYTAQNAGAFYGISNNNNLDFHTDSIQNNLPNSNSNPNSNPSKKLQSDLMPLHPLLQNVTDSHPAGDYNRGSSHLAGVLPSSLSISQLLGFGKPENRQMIPFKQNEPHEFMLVYFQMIVKKLCDNINNIRYENYKKFENIWRQNYQNLMQKKSQSRGINNRLGFYDNNGSIIDNNIAHNLFDQNGQNFNKNGPNIPEFEVIPTHTPHIQPPSSFYTTTLTTCLECGVTRSVESQQQLSLMVKPFACVEYIPLQGLIESLLTPKTISQQQHCDVCDLRQKIQLGHRLINALEKQIFKKFDDYLPNIPQNNNNFSQSSRKPSIFSTSHHHHHHHHAQKSEPLSSEKLHYFERNAPNTLRRLKIPGYTYGQYEKLNMYMDDNIYNVIYSDRFNFQSESYPQTLVRLQVEVVNLQYQLLSCFHPSLALFYQQQQAIAIHKANMIYLNENEGFGDIMTMSNVSNLILNQKDKKQKNQNAMKITLPFSPFDFLLQRSYSKNTNSLNIQQSLLNIQDNTAQFDNKRIIEPKTSTTTTDPQKKKTTHNKVKTQRKKTTTKNEKNEDKTPQIIIKPDNLFAALELGKYVKVDPNSSDYNNITQMTSLSTLSTIAHRGYTIGPHGGHLHGTYDDDKTSLKILEKNAQTPETNFQDDASFVYVTITIRPSGNTVTKLRFLQPTLSSFLAGNSPYSEPESTEEIIINFNAKTAQNILKPLITIIHPKIPYFDFYLRRIPPSLPPIIKPIPNKTSDYQQESFITTLPTILPICFDIFNHATSAKINTKIAIPPFLNASHLLPALTKRSLDRPTGLNTINMQYYRSQRPAQLTIGGHFGSVLTPSLPDVEEIESKLVKHPEEEYRDREDAKKALLLQRQKAALIKAYGDIGEGDDDFINNQDTEEDEATKAAILAQLNEADGKDINQKERIKNFGKNTQNDEFSVRPDDDFADIDVSQLNPSLLFPKPLSQQLYDNHHYPPQSIPHYDKGYYTTNPLFSALNVDSSQYDEYLLRKEQLSQQRKLFFTTIQPMIDIQNGYINAGNSGQVVELDDSNSYFYVVMAVIVFFGHSLDDPNGRFVTYRRVLPTFNLDAVGRRRSINFYNTNMDLNSYFQNNVSNSDKIESNRETKNILNLNGNFDNSILPYSSKEHQYNTGFYNNSYLSNDGPKPNQPMHSHQINTTPPSQNLYNPNLFTTIHSTSSLGIMGMSPFPSNSSLSSSSTPMDQLVQLPTMMQLATQSPFSLSTSTETSKSVSLGQNLHHLQQPSQLTPFNAMKYASGLREAFLFDHYNGTKRTSRERFFAIKNWLQLHSTWVLCTDTAVTPTSEFTVMSSVPYMVFYERI